MSDTWKASSAFTFHRIENELEQIKTAVGHLIKIVTPLQDLPKRVDDLTRRVEKLEGVITALPEAIRQKIGFKAK